MNQLNQQGNSEHIYCVLCGRMTPDQKQIVRTRAKVDTQLFIDVMTWFITINILTTMYVGINTVHGN